MRAAASRLDAWLAARGARAYRRRLPQMPDIRWVTTAAGTIRVLDTGGDGPCVMITPDGPNVIEHYRALVYALAPAWRVVCFDMPGFGFSAPSQSYDHSLDQGAAAILALMDQLDIDRATLAFSCANGFYAMRVSQLAPQRVHALLLSQTPSLAAMQSWALRAVPSILNRPLVGQLLGRLLRRQLAQAWYGIALPHSTDAGPFRHEGAQALRCGGCFSLAGVVQGLLREPPDAARSVVSAISVLWGSRDHSHRQTRADALLDDAPQARVVTLDACGHFPDLEDPERFAEVLRALMPAAPGVTSV